MGGFGKLNAIDASPSQTPVKEVWTSAHDNTGANSWIACEARNRLLCVDRIMRYGLIFAGQLGGIGTLSKSSKLRVISTVISVIQILWLTGTMIVAFITAWDEEQDSSLYSVFMKVAVSTWYSSVLFAMIALSVTSQRKSGLLDYYQHLAEAERSLTELGVTIRYSRIKNATKLILGCGTIFIIVNIIMKVVDYTSVQLQDPLFGASFVERVQFDDLTITLVQTFGAIGGVIVVINWIFSIAYFVTTCFVLTTILEDYNNKLENDIAESAESVLVNLEAYRTAHIKLCAAVEKADCKLSMIAGAHIGTGVIVFLIILYLASMAMGTPAIQNLLGAFIFWIGAEGIALSVLIIFAQRVNAATVAGYGNLMEVFQPNLPITNQQIYQMQLFLSKMSNPECLTTGGLMNIDKDLGITIISVVISYFLVMIQFNSSSTEDSATLPPTCNHTTILP